MLSRLYTNILSLALMLATCVNSLAANVDDTFDVRCPLHQNDNIVSMDIVMCNIDIDTAIDITPEMFDEGALDMTDNVKVTKKKDIKCLKNGLKKLRLFNKYIPNGLDTRGSLTISYKCGCEMKCYISYFFLYCNGKYYDIAPRSFHSVDFRVAVQMIMNSYPRKKTNLTAWFFDE